MQTKHLTITDYAKYKKVSRQTIYNWIKTQKLFKERDYLVLSDSSIVIVLNEFTS